MTRASSAFSLAALCWLVLALVASPCSGARATLGGHDRALADDGQQVPLSLQDGQLLGHKADNRGGSGRRDKAGSGTAHADKTKRSNTATITTDASTQTRNVPQDSDDRDQYHPRPLHRHNDFFEPPLERRGGSSSDGRNRQNSSPPAGATGDLQGGLHDSQTDRRRTTRGNLRGDMGGRP